VAKKMDIDGALKSWEFVQVCFKKKEAQATAGCKRINSVNDSIATGASAMD